MPKFLDLLNIKRCGYPWSEYQFPRVLKNAVYRRFWYASAVLAFGAWLERLAVGWFVLDMTESVFLTALSFAVRSAPSLVFAPVGGAVADRIDRRILLVITPLISAMSIVFIAVIAAFSFDAVWPILIAVAIGGIAHNFEMPARGAFISDLVGKKDAMSGIAVHGFGTRAVGLFGALTGGVVIASVGPVAVFSMGAVVFLIGALVMRRVHPQKNQILHDSRSLMRSTFDGVKLIFSLPAVAMLLLLAMVVEIFAFSYQALVPSIAKDVLKIGPIGLGALTATSGVGSLLGLVGLAVARDVKYKGLLIFTVTAAYGVAIFGFGASSVFSLSMLLILIVGAMAAVFDALQWTVLQENVPNRMRGRVLGGWMLAIGFGWVGYLEVGILGDAIGTQMALVTNGSVVVAVLFTVIIIRTFRLRSDQDGKFLL